MLFTTLVVIAALCLVFPSTRIYAVISAGTAFYLYPYLTLGILLVAGIAYYFIHRRNTHA